MAGFIHPDLIERHYSVALFKGYVILLQRKLGADRAALFFDKVGIPVEYFANQTNYVSEKWVDVFYTALRSLPEFQHSFVDESSKLTMSADAMGYLQIFVARFLSVSSFMRASIEFAKKINKVDYYKITDVSDSHLVFEFKSRRETEHFDFILDGWKSFLELAPTLRGNRRGICQISRAENGNARLEVKWQESAIKKWSQYQTPLFCIAIVLGAASLIFKSEFSWIVEVLSFFSLIALYLLSNRVLALAQGEASENTTAIEDVILQADQKHDELVVEKRKVDRRYREARLLNTVIQRIGLARDSANLIDLTMSELKHSLGYDRVLYMSKKGDVLSVSGHIGFHGRIQKLIDSYSIDLMQQTEEHFHLGNVFKRKDHILIPITDNYIDKLSSDAGSLIKLSGSKSFLLCSVASISNAHGVLMVDYNTEGKVLGQDDLHLVKNLSNQLAIYLDQVVAVEKELNLRQQFQKFVPRKIVEIAQADGFVQLATQKRDVSILFSDIRGFTKKSLEVPPETVTKALNIYFSEVNKIVYGLGGVVDKFLGDGVLAVFNAFGDCENHGRAATLAAIAMQNAMPSIEAQIRENLGLNSEWARWEIGIAVHSGEVISGLIGTDEKLEFTVLGDPVNLAARLCEVTKEHESSIIVSPETADLIGEGFSLSKIQEMIVRGHGRKITPYLVNYRDEQKKKAS